MAAEGLCEMVHRTEGLPCLVLRTSRFFPEADDRAEIRHAYADGNVKVTSCSYRRVDLEDCLLYTSPSPRDKRQSRMPSSA